MTSVEDELQERWGAEERPQPEGWDFSSLAARMTESTEPWDLDASYRTALATATRVLDMGTGGGEYLSSLADVLPTDTTATEGWPPNIPVARGRLAPLGIDVVEYTAPDEDVDALPMPFDDGRFDLVLNRHESFSPRELARVIVPGGQFVTQQVGGDEAHELATWFGEHRELPQVNLTTVVDDLVAAGFDDVAALLAYLQLVPWETPDDFSVDRYADQLLALHRTTGGGPVRMTRKRFWLRAVRR